MPRKQVSVSEAILFLQPPERRQHIVYMVGVFGVSGRIVRRAGVTRMVGIGGETIVDRGKASDVGDHRVFKEEIEGAVQLCGVNFRITPGTSVDEPRIIVSRARSVLETRASHNTQKPCSRCGRGG